ncbi:MAG TPA: hypothetical protein VG097_16450 [Gemmata sp.]|nr:hypothetical protein [Gemmata sp.]
MTEEDWLACSNPMPMLEFVHDRASQRKLRLFAVACCHTVLHWLIDKRSLKAVEVAEAFVDGKATEDDLRRAMIRAHRASEIIAGPPSRAVIWVAHENMDLSYCQYLTNDVATAFGATGSEESAESLIQQSNFVRDIFPFNSVTLNPSWLTSTVLALAQQMYDSRDFSVMPILADALQDAGCENEDILNHCRQPGEHVRGCFVVDLLLGKA